MAAHSDTRSTSDASNPLELDLPEGVVYTDEVLGEGEYGRVIDVKWRGVRCAGKLIHNALMEIIIAQENSEKVMEDFVSKSNLFANCHHPNIVHCFGVYEARGDKSPMLVMESMPLSLSRCFEKYSKLPSAVKYRILLGVSSGLAYLHGHQPTIAHCDLTANNVLLTEAMQAKIADFSIARVLAANKGLANHIKLSAMRDAYMPPEALGRSSPKYNKQVDIFSFGVLIIHVVSHELPIPESRSRVDDKDRSKVVTVSEVDRRADYIKKMGSEPQALRNLAESCLDNNSEKRPEITKIIAMLEKSAADKGAQEATPFLNMLEGAQILNSHDRSQLALTYQPLGALADTKTFVHMEIPSSDSKMVLQPPVNMPFCGKYVKTLAAGMYKPWGVATCKKSGRVFVVDNGGYDSILSYADGKSSVLVKSASRFQMAAPPEPTCWFPTEVAVMSENVLIVADYKRLMKVQLPHHPSGKITLKATTEDSLFKAPKLSKENPLGIGVTKDEKIIVCDREKHRLIVLNNNLKVLQTIGSFGAAPHQFHHPWGIAIDSKSNIYVSDCSNRCIKVLTPDFKHLRIIGGDGNTPENLRAPTGICIDANDYLYVADRDHRRVFVFNPKGEFKMYFGSYGTENGQFLKPLGIAVDKDGLVYVADGEGQRVQVFA